MTACRLTAILASTRDVLPDGVRPGGPAYYSTVALYLLGFTDFRVLTTEGLTYSVVRKLGIEVVPVGLGETVFELVPGDGRVLRLFSKAYMDLEAVVRYVVSPNLLVSLTASELTLKALKYVAGGRRVVVDVQGFVRRVGTDGLITHDYVDLPILSSLRCRELVLRGEAVEFPPECRGVNVIRCAAELGASIVVTDASGPTYFALSSGYGGYLSPPQDVTGDSVGSGDVFTAVFTYSYLVLGRDFTDSLALATAAATLKLRSRTPWYTVTEVESISRRVLDSLRRIAY